MAGEAAATAAHGTLLLMGLWLCTVESHCLRAGRSEKKIIDSRGPPQKNSTRVFEKFRVFSPFKPVFACFLPVLA
jgi:hypothetical protein